MKFLDGAVKFDAALSFKFDFYAVIFGGILAKPA